jgi:opacity protein-like surface antigen
MTPTSATPSSPVVLTRTALAAAALLTSLSAHAQTTTPALDRFSIAVGAFQAQPEMDLGFRSGSETLRFDGIKGKRETMPRVSAELLLGDSHGISLDAFRYGQSLSQRHEGAYSQGPVNLNAMVRGEISADLDVVRLGYRYWFGSGATRFGLGGGAGYYRLKAEATAQGSVSPSLAAHGFGAIEGTYSRQESQDAVAPMFEIGLRHQLTPSLRLFADGSGIQNRSGSKLRGNIYTATAGVEWFALGNVGLSLGYSVTDVDLKRNSNGIDRIRLKFEGPTAAVKVRF